MVKIGGKSFSKVSKRKTKNNVEIDKEEQEKLIESFKEKLNPFENWGVKIDVSPSNIDDGGFDHKKFNKNLSTSLLDKYFPKKHNDLIGLDSSLYNLEQWFKGNHEDSDKPFLVLGPIGCGKSTLIKYFLNANKLSYFFYNLYYGQMTKKDIMFKFKNYLQHGNYDKDSFWCKNEKKGEKLLVIDELQTVLSDTIGILDIYDIVLLSTGVTAKQKFKGKFVYDTFIKEKKNIDVLTKFKIIFISADGKGNKLQELKRMCFCQWIPTPIPESESLSWLTHITKQENIKSTKEDLKKIISFCKNDKRLMINSLSFLKINDNKIINIDNVLSCLKKDEDVSIWEFTDRLFDNIDPPTHDEIYQAWSTDGYILESMMWENYIDYGNDIEKLAQTADSMSMSDCYHQTIYNGVEYDSEIHCSIGLLREHYFARSDVKYNRCKLRTSYLNTAWHSQSSLDRNFSALQIKKYDVTFEEIITIKQFLHIFIKDDSKTIPEAHVSFMKGLLYRGWDIEDFERMHKHWNINNTKRVRGFSQKVINKINKIKNMF
jgi:hypothetical protein